ncbi:hypothetical protein RD110_15620 [Rhodoferax koreense]|uniref:Terminase small subunit n=1 Tax=Rhodoferax koreensis TaxID=1842727 RepID=A0A1P8JXM7_9BURK|nr:terminase small subunit [Rhodoferax koreense]APW38451.1 hypothetical protein RD110_15620 [Rhodoferax koreense]
MTTAKRLRPAQKAAIAQKTGKTGARTPILSKPAAPARTPQPLTAQQRLFISEYQKDRNATQAAIRAGYSKRTAAQQGSRLLMNVEISTAIEAQIVKRITANDLTEDRIARELACIAFLDPRRLVDANGVSVPLHELDEDVAVALAGVEVVEEWAGTGDERKLVSRVRKYRIASKVDALDKAMRYRGLFKRDNDQARPMVVIKDYTGRKAA